MYVAKEGKVVLDNIWMVASIKLLQSDNCPYSPFNATKSVTKRYTYHKIRHLSIMH